MIALWILAGIALTFALDALFACVLAGRGSRSEEQRLAMQEQEREQAEDAQ